MGNGKSKVAKAVTYQCPNCKEEVTKPSSQIPSHFLTKRFIDERTGDEHVHDPNTGTVTIICKRGHKSQQPYYTRCWCGWTNEEGDPQPPSRSPRNSGRLYPITSNNP